MGLGATSSQGPSPDKPTDIIIITTTTKNKPKKPLKVAGLTHIDPHNNNTKTTTHDANMRRPILPARAMRRQLIIPARHITTKPATFANIKYELLQRPTRIYCEDLTPRNSHLLARSLQDFLPPEAQAPVPLQHPEPWELLDWGHHLVYFAPLHATTSLLPDGTDADHSPGPPFTRRVWAGGSIAFFHHRGTGLGSLDDDGGGGASVAARGAARGFCTEEIEDVRLKGVPPGEEARTFHAPGAGEKVFVDLVRRIGWNRDAGGGGAGTDDGMASSISVSDISIVERRTLCFMVPSPTAQAGADVANRHERRGRREFRPTKPPLLLALCCAFRSCVLLLRRNKTVS